MGREDVCWEKGSAHASLIHSLTHSFNRQLLIYYPDKRLSLGREGHTG